MAKTPVRKGNSKQFAGILVVVAIIGVAVIGYLVSNNTRKTLTVDPNVPAGPAEGYLLGRADAPVQVLEFGDFECPGCGQFATVTEPDIRIRLINTGIISFRFFDLPLNIHRNTWAAHNAAACANDEGKFWEMHDRIFETQDEWNSITTNNPKKVLKRLAQEVGMNVDTWEKCFDTQKHAARIKGNEAEAIRRNVNSTPTFVIGDKQIPGKLSYDEFKAYVDTALAKVQSAAAAPPKALDAKKGAKP